MNDSEDTSGKKGAGRILAVFIGLALLIAAAGGVWWLVVVRPAEAAMGGTMARVERFLGNFLGGAGTITVNESATVMKISEVSEIALLEYQMKVTREVEDEQVIMVFPSRKSLRMEGTFKVKIGYDISEGLSIEYDESGQARVVGLGEPKVLTAEMLKMNTLEETSGLWNKVKSADRDRLVEELRYQAIRDVKESGMLSQLDELMRLQLRSLLGVEDLEVMPAERVLP
ncbi:MAG: DUF4230 domain-containing protein [Verrucomicrobiota bacterium JB023]|nr:DUF4230 domain-containing protein [Verrucomicrobiota bacterium JB023]